jgi:hypothetical protein
MQNERELWIEEIVARMREERGPATDLLQCPTSRPGCPNLADVMDVALDEASPEVARCVEEHLPGCDYCRACLAAYQKSLQDQDVSWEEIASGPEDRVGEEPQPGDRPAPVREDNRATRVEGDTSISPTSLAHQAARRPALLTWLAACLPDLLRAMRLPEQWTDDLRAWVTQRLPHLGEQRLSDALAVWATEFAGARGMTGGFTPLTPAVIRSVVASRSVEDVLRQHSPDEPEWACAFRQWALSRRPASAKALLTLEPEGRATDDNLRAFRRALYQKAQQLYQEYQDAL